MSTVNLLLFKVRLKVASQVVQSNSTKDYVRPVDQSVLDLLRQAQGHPDQPQGLTVHDLTSALDVTPTAVRQRLERLVELELVERRKESVGRGRPQFRYVLTELGCRYGGASYVELATALWEELMDLPNPKQRSRVLRRVAHRMGQGLRRVIPAEGSLEEKLAATAQALEKRKVTAKLSVLGELPVLEVQSCPYPDLADTPEGRQLCEVEQEMLSEALGQAVELDCCRLDGHENCHFRPVRPVSSAPAAD